MKILLLGKNGQVGWELQRSLAALGELLSVDRARVNLTNQSDLAQILNHFKPNIIVNAAAYTLVDKAEKETQLADNINHVAVGFLAKQAQALDALLIHYSTDYVFNGEGSKPWVESDQAKPLNYYGLSKYAGEQAIINSGCKFLIFRTSWVYGNFGNNFIKTILRLGAEKPELNIINDQIGAPTSAELLADCTAFAIRKSTEQSISGVFHLAASGETSWFAFANLIITTARKLNWPLIVKNIEPITSDSYPTLAKRPLNSRLNTSKFCQTFDLTLPAWQSGVVRIIQELSGNFYEKT